MAEFFRMATIFLVKTGIPLLALAAVVLSAIEAGFRGVFLALSLLLGGVLWGIVGILLTIIWGCQNLHPYAEIILGLWLFASCIPCSVMAFNGWKHQQCYRFWSGICGTSALFLLWTSFFLLMFLAQGI